MKQIHGVSFLLKMPDFVSADTIIFYSHMIVMFFVSFPIYRVLFDIFDNFTIFLLVSDNPVVIRILPQSIMI